MVWLRPHLFLLSREFPFLNERERYTGISHSLSGSESKFCVLLFLIFFFSHPKCYITQGHSLRCVTNVTKRYMQWSWTWGWNQHLKWLYIVKHDEMILWPKIFFISIILLRNIFKRRWKFETFLQNQRKWLFLQYLQTCTGYWDKTIR